MKLLNDQPIFSEFSEWFARHRFLWSPFYAMLAFNSHSDRFEVRAVIISILQTRKPVLQELSYSKSPVSEGVEAGFEPC